MAGSDQGSGDEPTEERASTESLDESMIDQEPDEAAVEEPTRSPEDAEAEAAWALHEEVSIGVIAIGATLLFALALLQMSGLSPFEPVVQSQAGQWAIFGVLTLGLAALFLWSRRGV